MMKQSILRVRIGWRSEQVLTVTLNQIQNLYISGVKNIRQ